MRIFAALAGSSVNSGNPTDCRAWTYESPSNGGGSGVTASATRETFLARYSGCDLGITTTGLRCPDDRSSRPAGETIPAGRPESKSSAMCSAGRGDRQRHGFRVALRGNLLLQGNGRGRGRARIGAQPGNFDRPSGRPARSAFPRPRGFIFRPAAISTSARARGRRGTYFNSTAVTNGTCTYTLTTTSGATATGARRARRQRHALLAHCGK